MYKSGSHSYLLYKTILYVTIVFSGHYDSQEGSPSYVLSAEAIQDLQQSINSTEVRSFLFWEVVEKKYWFLETFFKYKNIFFTTCP